MPHRTLPPPIKGTPQNNVSDSLQTKNSEVAFNTFNQLHQKGVITASIELAKCYQQAIGTKQDHYKAYQILNKALEETLDIVIDVNLRVHLGICYRYGLGTDKVQDKENDYLNNHSFINFHLEESFHNNYAKAYMYEKQEDFAQAKKYYQAAAAENYYNAAQEAEIMNKLLAAQEEQQEINKPVTFHPSPKEKHSHSERIKKERSDEKNRCSIM